MMDAKTPNGVNGTAIATNGTNGVNGHTNGTAKPAPATDGDAASAGTLPVRVKREFKREASGPMNVPAFKADVEEGDSPRLLTEDNPTAEAAEKIALPATAVTEEKQVEDADEGGREGDIYADAVLQCSIENKEACVMCSG
jgi:ribonucleoside-diphosphate reductase subunit M1